MLLLRPCLLLLAPLLFAPIDATFCQNGGTLVNYKCQCVPGYYGKFCANPICVHGQKGYFNDCECDIGWAGIFCNETAEERCVHGELIWNDYCSCDQNWMGKRCNKLYCGYLARSVSDTECACTYGGVYPNCTYSWWSSSSTILIVFCTFFGTLFVVMVPLFVVSCRRYRTREAAKRVHISSPMVISPPQICSSSSARPVAATVPFPPIGPPKENSQSPPSYEKVTEKGGQ